MHQKRQIRLSASYGTNLGLAFSAHFDDALGLRLALRRILARDTWRRSARGENHPARGPSPTAVAGDCKIEPSLTAWFDWKGDGQDGDLETAIATMTAT